jgi:hypothetical protein
MIDGFVAELVLMSYFNEEPEVKNVSCILEIVINSCMAIILGVNKKSWVT